MKEILWPVSVDLETLSADALSCTRGERRCPREIGPKWKFRLLFVLASSGFVWHYLPHIIDYLQQVIHPALVGTSPRDRDPSSLDSGQTLQMIPARAKSSCYDAPPVTSC